MTTDPLQLPCPHCGALNRVPAARLGEHPACGRCKAALFEGKPLVLTSADFDRHATQSDLPLLVDFWAPWCGPCRTMAPQFAQAAGLLEPRVRLAKVDTDAEPALAQRYAIRSIPTLALIQRGRELGRMSGALPAAELVRWTRQFV